MLRAIRWKTHLQEASFPLFMLAGFFLLMGASRMFDTPGLEETLTFLQGLFQHWGLYALYGCAFLEGIFMVSLYFPGSLVIFSAILLSDRSPEQLLLITCICWLAFMTAGVVNYVMGEKGFHRLFNAFGAQRMIAQAAAFLNRFGTFAYVLGAFHPNYLAILEVYSGIAKHGQLKTLTLAAYAMLISGPVLVFGSAMFIEGLVRGGGLDLLFLGFIAMFAAWACIALARGILQDISAREKTLQEA